MFQKFEKIFEDKIRQVATSEDPSHDFLHFQRVVKTAKEICHKENADFNIVVPAAWLHDLIIVPKNDSRRKMASRLSAEAAVSFLLDISYPQQYIDEIAHSIEAHSFSANIEAKTLEAKIVQDADRLDGLGAIGISRCFATSGVLKSLFYSEQDPFCSYRKPDDQKFTVDHFYAKLFKVADSLKTETAREIGSYRVGVMKSYLSSLASEIEFTRD